MTTVDPGAIASRWLGVWALAMLSLAPRGVLAHSQRPAGPQGVTGAAVADFGLQKVRVVRFCVQKPAG